MADKTAPRRRKTSSDEAAGGHEAQPLQVEEAIADAPPPATGGDAVRDYMEALTAAGLSGEEIMLLVGNRFGGGDAAQPQAAPPTPGQGEHLGPDPEMVRRYNAMLKTYRAPKLKHRIGAIDREDGELREKIVAALKTVDWSAKPDAATVAQKILDGCHEHGGVELSQMFFDWVKSWAAWETVRRRAKEPVPLVVALAQMVREHWQRHGTERAMLQGAATGPANNFNQQTGTYQ